MSIILLLYGAPISPHHIIILVSGNTTIHRQREREREKERKGCLSCCTVALGTGSDATASEWNGRAAVLELKQQHSRRALAG
jgi:hypothetical protein